MKRRAAVLLLSALVVACKVATDLDSNRSVPPPNLARMFATNCARTSIPGITSIPQLGAGAYLGQQGGLYPGGTNTIPAAHLALGLSLSAQVQPRDASGNVDFVNGKIVQISMGASTAVRVFAGDSGGALGVYGTAFKPLADADPAKNPKLVIINGALAQQPMRKWIQPNDTPWVNLDNRLAAAGVTPAQVQVAWLMIGETRTGVGFPGDEVAYRDSMEIVVRNLKSRYPNTNLAYLSTHYYQGYRSGTAPEPANYEQGYGLKWVIEDQITQQRNLNADPSLGPVVAPWVSWGTQLWSNGIIANNEGLLFVCADFDTAGVHLVRSGINKAGPKMLSFFMTDPTTLAWFINNTGQVGDLVWYDVNGNGVQDATEPGLAGLRVTLTGPGVAQTGTTDGSGHYLFTGLPAGSYSVSVATPAGFIPTPTNAAGSNSNNDSNGSPAAATLPTNTAADASIDIGFTMGVGAIGDFVWNDLNRNGVQDAGEAGLEGVPVTLSGAAGATTTTDANGNYVFGSLLAGTYTVTVATPSGFSPSLPNQGGDPLKDSDGNPATVTLATNSSSTLGVDVGLMENLTGQVGDFVWYDVNGNGVQDATEPGISGVSVTLTGPGGTSNATTDGTGHYLFTGLGAGNYSVAVATPSGFVGTPSAQGGDPLKDSNGNPASVSLPTNSSGDLSIDIGFTQGVGVIGDFVWDDLDRDGVQDLGEPGLPGVLVTLSGAGTGTTNTDANGHYVFGSLFAGTYTVTVAVPNGYSASPSNLGGDPLKDSNGSPMTVTLATNASSDLAGDVGFVQNLTGQLGDFVWYDVDGNGVQDATEPGISGVTVTLTGPNGTATTSTDGTGHYLFTGLGAGTYFVAVATPSGFIPTAAHAVGSTTIDDSDNSPASVNLATNASGDLSIDFGFTRGVGVIGDLVWDDLNGDGVQDVAEPGLPGVMVTLTGAANATTTTDASGAYVFGSLFAGSYIVTVATPGGYNASPSTQGGDPLKDSNGSPANVTLSTNASSDLSVDFGFAVNLTGQIGDVVWYDVDGNGVQDGVEPGIAGLTVTLSGPGGSRTATTDPTGHYLFSGLGAGAYTVTVSTPAGFIPTVAHAAGSTSSNDSDASPASVSLATNTTSNLTVDFGFTQGSGVIGDVVWNDLDGDGVQDAGEPGLSGVTVTLSGEVSATTTTDAAGGYVFGSLFAGSYTVTVSAPGGYSASPSGQGGDPLKDSNGSPAPETLATNASTALSVDFGFVENRVGQIGDLVWYDVNGNGIQDVTEPGIAGVAVTLTGPGGTQNTTTDGTGHYTFAALGAGSYSVSVATPSGFIATPSHAAGSTSNNDSDGSPAAVSLATNSSADPSIDIGFTKGVGAIGDFVWDDLNRNGAQDAGEPGLAGLTVTLSGAASATTTTDANGNYVFGSLFAGAYTVTVAPPSGYSATPSNQGGDALKDSNGSPAAVTLATNASAELAIDFGFRENQTGQIGDFVWYDVNENGMQDGVEPGMSGLTVTLTGPGGPRTTTTDVTGHYVFSALGTGNYTVSVATPAGFVPTPSNQGGDPLQDSNGSPAAVNLPTNASSDLSIDLGFTQGNGVIGDVVWDDLNGDGVQDAGEPGLPGVTVTLSGAASATTTTDATGHYVFGSLFAGSYTVTVSTPIGYSASPSGQGGDPLKDSNASPASVTLATNASSDLSVDAGFVVNLTGQVGDRVWYDVNGNGIQDATEPGIAGLTVNLTGPGGPQTTTTDASGHYLFAGLAAGTYSVSVATPGGFILAPTAQGGDPLQDSNGSPAAVNLATPSSTDASIDVGFTKGVGVIGDFVWDDLNADGVQDAGEPGLAGLTVTLSGAASATTTTDANGNYVFGSLFAGAYTVTVAPPSGYSATPSNQGGDALKDSNGSPAAVSLATNASAELAIDFGFVQDHAAQLGDFVWSDLNGNGVQDGSEPGISGLTVTLAGPGGPQTATTDGTGRYLFSGLAAGNYTVSVATPSGFVPTPSNAPGSNGGNDSNGSPATVDLATNATTDLSIDFGFTQGAGTIGDFVWDDLNGDGVQDAGEPGLPGVTVTLSGAASATTTTDAAGHYVFGSLFAGSYTVTVSTPIGYSASPSGQGGDPLKDSNASPASVTLATNASSDLSVDAGFVVNLTGQVGDRVWYDVNGNGIQDATEPGIAGVAVTLTGPGGTQNTTTDGTGHYLFNGLAAGSYTVTTSTPSGFSETTPNAAGSTSDNDSNGSPASVTLAANSSVDLAIDVGFTKGVGVIGDFVWDDLNADGVQDAGEPGLAGLTVTLSGAASATTTTDANGNYVFGSLFAGAYTVTVAPPSGYSATPSNQGGDALKDSNGSPAAVTLATNASAELAIDFGFRENQTGQIGDFVWYDVNENGMQDGVEPGMSGLTVTLTGPGGPRTTTTDVTGHYVFSALGTGNYTVSVATPAGFVPTPSNQGGDPLQDSNGSPAAVNLPTNASSDLSIDLGFTQGNGVIGDVVWDDLNGDGVQDAGEPGLPGVTVTLSGAASATTTTDATGHYVFGSLFAGSYTVTVSTPIGYSASPSGQGGDPLKDSNASPASVTLATNASSDLSVDAGFVVNLTGQVGDRVWYDVNGNGIQDATEPGIAGLTVNLTGPGGPQTTTTDASGHYLFAGLAAGTYSVSVATPGGFILAPTAQGGDPLQDSDGSPAAVNLATPSSTDASIDVGFTKGVGVIGDFVWDDLNADGVQDAGEPGLAGLTVTLSGAASATTTTDANGNYVFGSLFAGAYTVTVAPPSGYGATPSNQGGDAQQDSNGSPAAVTLATNASAELAIDFGFVQEHAAQLGDFVWSDLNGNGVQDGSEPGISGLTVTLAGPGGPQTATTDGTGRYLFSGLAAGNYTVSVATPSGFVPTPSNAPGSNGGNDSNGSPATVDLATNATTDLSIDFGFTQGAGTIGDVVWDDLNGDGVQDAGEPGLSGVTVALSGAASATTSTATDGSYNFGGLFAGTYTVTVTTPSGFVPSAPSQGGDPLKDSNGSPATVTLATNTSTDGGIDFGFVVSATGQVGDFVWYDVNGNGVQDSGEAGIAGVTVTLTGPGGPQVATTDGSGHYLFTGLGAGSFSVSVTTPSGYVLSPSNLGSDPLKDSNGNPATVNLASNSSADLSIDVGFTQGTGSIGDFVWNDLNANGVQDVGEPGLAGVTVALSGAGTATTTTAANGSYAFPNLFAGAYTVTVTTPSGYSPTLSNQGGDPLKDSNGSPASVTLATNSTASPSIDFGFVSQGQIITLDRTSTATSGTALVTSRAWSHTITAGGTNRILLVSVGIRNKSSQTVSTVRWGTASLTRIQAVSQASNVRSEMWYLINPATGTNTITVTLSGAGASVVVAAASYTGVHQTTPLGTPVTKGVPSNKLASLTVSSAVGQVVVDAVVKQNFNESQVANAGQVRRWIAQSGRTPATESVVFAGSDKPGATTVSMGWSSSAARPWAMVAVPLKPAP